MTKDEKEGKEEVVEGEKKDLSQQNLTGKVFVFQSLYSDEDRKEDEEKARQETEEKRQSSPVGSFQEIEEFSRFLGEYMSEECKQDDKKKEEPPVTAWDVVAAQDAIKQHEVQLEENRKLTERLKEYATKKLRYSPPYWLLYVVGGIALVALLYGGVQQFRIWRWNKLLKASYNRILKLETSQEKEKLELVRKLSENAIKPRKEEAKKIKKKIEALDKKEKAIDKSVDRMDPEALLKAFKEEGF